MSTFRLRCIAPDGATVKEGEFPTIADAWERAQDMGSRWIFYPVHVVTGASPTDLARVLDTPRELESFKGRSLRTLSRAIAANSQAVCDWMNGDLPLLLD